MMTFSQVSAFVHSCYLSYREGYYAELDLLLSSMRSHAVTSTHMALYYLCQAELNITLNKDIR